MPPIERVLPDFRPGQWPLVTIAVGLGIVNDFLMSGYRHIRSFVAPPDARTLRRGAPGYPTIVPIAGLWERWDFLYPLLRHLNAIGYPVHVVPSLGRQREPAETLAHRVLDELRAQGVGDVVLVGHSKGGLIGKGVLLLARPEDRVLGLVSLAAPFRGSQLSNLVRDIEVIDMRPSSRQTILLARYDAADDRILNLASTLDQVLGRDNRIASARNDDVDRVGHFGLLGRRETHTRVAAELARALDLPERYEAPDDPLPRRLRGRLQDIARDYGFAIGWQLRSIAPGRARLRRWRTGDPTLPPVVLLPGVLERWPMLRSIGDRLHRRGHTVHVVPELGFNMRDVAAQGRIVVDALERLDLRDAVIVAHSKGGLIGKSAMLDPRGADRVRGLVAIATPFSGSEYARLFTATSIREFSPTSRIIRSLGWSDTTNGRIVSIWPSFDPHIPSPAYLPGAADDREVPLTGHFRILGSALLHDEVERAVELLGTDGAARARPQRGAWRRQDAGRESVQPARSGGEDVPVRTKRRR